VPVPDTTFSLYMKICLHYLDAGTWDNLQMMIRWHYRDVSTSRYFYFTNEAMPLHASVPVPETTLIWRMKLRLLYAEAGTWDCFQFMYEDMPTILIAGFNTNLTLQMKIFQHYAHLKN
jgi:hypothetical protein